jgi:hypothetical protein
MLSVRQATYCFLLKLILPQSRGQGYSAQSDIKQNSIITWQ